MVPMIPPATDPLLVQIVKPSDEAPKTPAQTSRLENRIVAKRSGAALKNTGHRVAKRASETPKNRCLVGRNLTCTCRTHQVSDATVSEVASSVILGNTSSGEPSEDAWRRRSAKGPQLQPAVIHDADAVCQFLGDIQRVGGRKDGYPVRFLAQQVLEQTHAARISRRWVRQ